MSDTDVSAFLMQLELDQLDKIMEDLQARIRQKAQEKSKPRFPPSFSDLDAMADSVGLDLSSLIKDIKRRS